MLVRGEEGTSLRSCVDEEAMVKRFWVNRFFLKMFLGEIMKVLTY